MTILLSLIAPLLIGPSAVQQASDFVELTIPRVTVQPGDSSMIVIGVRVKQGYHIQAEEPEDEYLIPTRLEIDPAQGMRVSRPEIPPGHTVLLSGTPWNVLDGSFEMRVVVHAANVSPSPDEFLRATLRFQACDDKRCFAPESLDFVIPLMMQTKTADRDRENSH
ncbi:MAG: protein-disulfide reductase DsbD N-terminal domain-containing protein [Ignavibacteria bacterium]|nr:protein-disulfide reductase DsbD N-terminal domain-containing protein [Ignavibacteria bacterium]